MTHVLKYGLLSLIVFVLPLFASAATFESAKPPLKSVRLQLSYNGKPLTSGTLSVAKGTDAKLSWTTFEGTKGCVNNWDSQTGATGTSEGEFIDSRYFIITCYGIGTAQTAKLRVNVVYPDLSVSSVKINGLVPVMTGDGSKVKKNTYKKSDGVAPALKINVTIRNTGGISSPVSLVAYELGIKDDEGTIGKGAVASGLSVPVITKGGSSVIDIPISAGATAGTAYSSGLYYRVIVDSGKTVEEGPAGSSKETNNISRWFGPFMFE